jgi:transposase
VVETYRQYKAPFHAAPPAAPPPPASSRAAWGLQAKAVLGCTGDTVADVGYYHGEEIKTCLAAGTILYLARPSTSATQKLGLFSKDDFTYYGATDTYQWPAGERLTCRFATVELGRPIRYDATSACRACPLK